MRGSIESLGMQGKQSFPKFAYMGKSHINQTQPSKSPTQQNSGQKKCQPSSHLCQPSEQADSPSARAALPHPQGRRLCHRKKIQRAGYFSSSQGLGAFWKATFWGALRVQKKGQDVKKFLMNQWISFHVIKFSPPINHTHLDKNPQVFLIFNHPTTEKTTKQLLPKFRIRKHQVSQPPLPLVSQFQGQWFALTGGHGSIFFDRGLRLDHLVVSRTSSPRTYRTLIAESFPFVVNVCWPLGIWNAKQWRQFGKFWITKFQIQVPFTGSVFTHPVFSFSGRSSPHDVGIARIAPDMH